MAIRMAALIGKHANTTLVSFSKSLTPIIHLPSPYSASRPFLETLSVARPRIGSKYLIRGVQGSAADIVVTKKENEGQSSENWKVKMLYDGECPLCMREVDMLRNRNKRYGTIKFVDISSDEYSPADNQGLAYETVMGRIHAILSDGTVVTDVKAFRTLYEAVGLGWVYAITNYKAVARIADIVYGLWAKYRLQITGRPPLQEVLEARKKKCSETNKCNL